MLIGWKNKLQKNIMKIKTSYIIIAVLVALLLLETTCNGKTEDSVKTTINISQIKDSIRSALLKEVKPVYIDTSKSTIKWLKPERQIIKKDSIVYVTQKDSTENVIKANQYDTQLKANEATADLKITTTGQLLDVSGTINYSKEINTIERTKYINKSAFFIYGSMPISSQLETPEIGIMYNFRNKIILGAGGQYNNLTNNLNATVTLAVKL